MRSRTRDYPTRENIGHRSSWQRREITWDVMDQNGRAADQVMGSASVRVRYARWQKPQIKASRATHSGRSSCRMRNTVRNIVRPTIMVDTLFRMRNNSQLRNTFEHPAGLPRLRGNEARYAGVFFGKPLWHIAASRPNLEPVSAERF